MRKLKKLLKAAKIIIRKPYMLNLVIDENENWKSSVIKKYNLPYGFPQVQLGDLFPNFSEQLESFSFLGGGSLPTDIALLKSLCRKFENTSYFEIGTWRGESVYNVSKVATECFTLNLSKQEIEALGLEKKYADAHFFFSKNLPNVIQLEGDSRTFNYAALNKKFDIIFIDGNHEYDFVKSDTQKVFKHLIHENSIVVWHDYAYNPESLRFEVMNAILDSVPEEFHSNLYHVANTMCAIFIRGKIKADNFNTLANPKCTYEVALKLKPL